MEEAKQLLLSLEFDTEEALRRAANFRSAVDADKEALNELNKVIKKGGELNEEQLVQREKLEQNIKKNTKSRTDEIRALESYLKATKNSIDANGKYNGSINNLRGSVSFLTAKWNDLTKEERENAKVGGVLQKEIKGLSDQLKEMEGSVGDNRRSVGGYLDAIRQAPGVMGKMRAGIDGIGLAVKANPLGLLMTILPLIAGLFKSSGEGADFFEKVMQQVNAVVQVGMKYLVQFGGFLVDAGEKAVSAFKNPKKILSELVDFLKNNLLNRFKAFAVILEGIQTADFRKITDGVIQFGTGITDASKKAKDLANNVANGVNKIGKDLNDATSAAGILADRLDKLAVAESKFSAASSKTRLEIQRLIAESKNRNLSEKEKIALLDRADKMEVGMNKRAIKLAEERMALIKEENKIKQSDEDEEIARENEQQEKINELRGQSLVLQEKLQARKDALAEAAAEREAKRLEKQAKAEAEYNEKRQKAILLMAEFEAGLEQLREDKAKQLEEARKASLQKQFEANNKFVKEELALSKLRVAAAEKEAQDKIAAKQREFQAVSNFANAASGLAAALANESSAFADFQKAVTLFQIGLASAEALAKGIAASQDIPFPGNLIAMGTTIATIATNILQAKQLISGSAAPKFKAAAGGLLEGPSHNEGGITGTGRFANVEVEGGEAIINKNSTRLFAPILSAINQLGGGKPLAPTNYAAMGGYLPSTVRNSLGNNGQIIDYDKLAKAMAAQPAPVVGISDIKAASERKDARNRRVTLGA